MAGWWSSARAALDLESQALPCTDEFGSTPARGALHGSGRIWIQRTRAYAVGLAVAIGAFVKARFNDPIARTCRYSDHPPGAGFTKKDAIAECSAQLVVLFVGPAAPETDVASAVLKGPAGGPPTLPWSGDQTGQCGTSLETDPRLPQRSGHAIASPELGRGHQWFDVSLDTMNPSWPAFAGTGRNKSRSKGLRPKAPVHNGRS
jgi:hypothetical protein